MNIKNISLALSFLITQVLFSQTYTFTPAGATGRFGPTQIQLNTAYGSTNLNGLVSTTAGVQHFTVPATGMYRIKASGATGGQGIGTSLGRGAVMEGDFNLTGGQVIKICVGQAGGAAFSTHGGGGGGSFVTDINSTPLIVAGGGGGRFFNPYSVGSASMAGTTGTSGMPGSNGNASVMASSGGVSGGGGGVATTFTIGQGSGGGGLIGNGVSGNPSTGGLSFINGCNGGAAAFLAPDIAGDGGFGGGGGADWSLNLGAGGGGGYSGGGGGTYFGFGGGGGSFNSGINQVNAAGTNSTQGSVIFTKISGVNIVQTASVSCHGQLTAALTASAYGGIAPYTYSWAPAGGFGPTATGLGAGIYTCTAIDANAIVHTNTFVITQPSLLVASISQTNVSCFGQSNGVAKMNVSGGIPPYTYNWVPGAFITSSLTGLAAGLYSCTVSDANNCANTPTVLITEPPVFSVFGIATSPTICAGETTILLGGGGLTYTWTNGVTNAVAFTPTLTNTYTLTGANAAGCTATTVTSIVVKSTPTLNIIGSGTLCTGNSLTLSPSGANSYTWSHSADFSTTVVSPTLTTTYSLTAEALNGCRNTAVKTVSVINITTVTAHASSTAVCMGNTVSLYGGGAATYTWSGGVTNNVFFTPTLSGTYSVSGEGACGTASATVSVVVNALPPVAANASATLVCSGLSITLSGAGAASYTWSGGVVNNSAFTLFSNATYTVTGSDANGCKNTAIKTISINSLPIVSAGVSSSSVCLGAPVTFNGNGAITYTWTGGVSNNTPFTPSGSGTYTVSGTDSNGCTNSASTSVNVITAPVIGVNSSSSTVCYGGTVALSATGATTFTWTGNILNNVAFTPTLTQTYTVSGSNACFTSTNAIAVAVNALPVITASATQSVLCQGNSTALFGGGGTTYTWTGGVSNNVSFIPLSSANYTVTGTDVNGCKSTATKSISVNSLPTISAYASHSVVCYGETVVLNASGAVSYTWSGNVLTGIAFTPTMSSSYTVAGTDANGCQNTATQSITVNSLPVVTASASNLSICMGGSVTLTAGGADTYTWTGGITDGVSFIPTSTSSYSVSGSHTLTGCVSTNVAVYTITVNPLPVVSANISSPEVCAGDAIVLSGTNADTYSWSDGILDGVPFIPSITGSYTVTGTNILTGCINSAVQGVTVYALPSLSITASNSVVCMGQPLTLGVLGADTFTWTNGIQNLVPFIPSASSVYSVTGTNTLTGCMNTLTQSITVNSLPVVGVLTTSTSVCMGETVTLSGSGANSYTFTNNVLNGIPFAPGSSATYSVTGTNTLTGCTSTNAAFQTISVNTLPVLLVNSSANIICSGEIATLSVSGANTYSWNTSETTAAINVTPLVTTTFVVSGMDGNGCRSQQTFVQEVSECLGVEVQKAESDLGFVLYPNPNNGEFFIRSDVGLNLTIMNELGSVVKRFLIKENQQQFHLISDLPAGIYFVIGEKGNKIIRTKMIITK